MAKAAALRQTSLPVGLSYHLPTSGPLTPKQYRERLTCSDGTQHVFLPQSKWVPACASPCTHPASPHSPVQLGASLRITVHTPRSSAPAQGVQDCISLWARPTSLSVPSFALVCLRPSAVTSSLRQGACIHSSSAAWQAAAQGSA